MHWFENIIYSKARKMPTKLSSGQNVQTKQ